MQLAHSVVELLSVSACPATQAVHTLLPVTPSVFVTLPGAQTVHKLDPGEGENNPAAQLLHTTNPAEREYLPAVQLPHAVVEELSASACPAAHAVHVLAPAALSMFVTLPAPHVAQALNPGTAENKPAVQLLHIDRPTTPP